MRLGFLTSCLPDESLEQIAGWAGRNGFAALEIAAWPAGDPRRHAVTHLDVTEFTTADAHRTRAMLAGHGVTASALGYYENQLEADPERRSANHRHLLACLEAAAQLEIGVVGTFVGRDLTRTVEQNLELAAEVFTPLVKRADDLGVTLAVENCPMPSWHPDGYPGNLAYSPELWQRLAEFGLRLFFDPSHLPGLGIDPVRALREHSGLVAAVQAKDVETFPELRDRYGFHGPALGRAPGDRGWWRYRIPGLGQLDWAGLLAVLTEAGYRGLVSVEHEDPVWSGDNERVRRGLLIARDTLAPYL